MSWAAHELEAFGMLRELGKRVSFLALLLGSLAPDFLTKLYTYGLDVGGVEFKASNPAQFHRGWPGMGWTSSLMAGVFFAALVYLLSRRNPAWAVGSLIGYWAHAITDCADSAGTMLFWPISFDNYSIGMWAYGAGEGKHGDAIAYYSSLGLVIDAAVLVLVIVFAWRVLSGVYFFEVVKPVDPAWAWLQKRFSMPDRVLLAAYRSFFFYGATRIVAWTVWAHGIEGAPWDLSWGGPWWVAPFVRW